MLNDLGWSRLILPAWAARSHAQCGCRNGLRKGTGVTRCWRGHGMALCLPCSYSRWWLRFLQPR